MRRVLIEDNPNVCLLNKGELTHTGGELYLTLVLGDLAAGDTWKEHRILTRDHFATFTILPVAPLAAEGS